MEIFQKLLTKEEIQHRFIEAVYALIKQDKSLTKTSLAESLNVKPSKFSEILNNRMKAGVDMIAILCDFWNVSPDWILMSRGGIFRDESDKQPIWVREDNAIAPSSESTQDSEVSKRQSPIITQLVDTIKEQAEEIGRLKARIEELEQHRGDNAGHAQSSDIADVG